MCEKGKWEDKHELESCSYVLKMEIVDFSQTLISFNDMIHYIPKYHNLKF
jgi:hypothetical protein